MQQIPILDGRMLPQICNDIAHNGIQSYSDYKREEKKILNQWVIVHFNLIKIKSYYVIAQCSLEHIGTQCL